MQWGKLEQGLSPLASLTLTTWSISKSGADLGARKDKACQPRRQPHSVIHMNSDFVSIAVESNNNAETL